MSKPPILKNAALQQRLDEDGFVKIVLDDNSLPKQLQQCYSRFETQHRFSDGGFHHTTHHTANWQLIDEVDAAVKQLAAPYLQQFFQNAEVLAANFMIKDPGQATEFVPHQDWTLMDEEKYYSVNLWIPLQDVTAHNGALHFLKGSHKVSNNLRMAPNFPELFGSVMPLVYPHLTSLPLQLGEAVLFQCAVLHGSFANVSNQRRVSAMVGLYSIGAPFTYYYNTQQGQPPMVEMYEMPVDKFVRFRERSRPDFMPPTKIFAYNFPVLTQAEFERWYSVM